MTSLRRVDPVEFGYSAAAAGRGTLGLAPRRDGRRHVGVVAQDLHRVAPEMVLVDKVGCRGVSRPWGLGVRVISGVRFRVFRVLSSSVRFRYRVQDFGFGVQGVL
jgi:hypothetical protein